MSGTAGIRFSELVEKQLGSDEISRDLWRPIAQEFDRAGPDAAKEYLEAEAQRLMEHVEKLLSQVKEG